MDPWGAPHGAMEIAHTALHWLLGLRNVGSFGWLVSGFRDLVWAGAPSAAGPRVAFTFDDALGNNPGDGHPGLMRLLEVLEAHGARGTFFVIADDRTTKFPDVLRNLSDRGHEIGNHGLADAFMFRLNDSAAKEAFLEWERRIAPVLGGWPREGDRKWFRPPRGAMSSALAGACATLGYDSVLGDIYADDYMLLDTEFHIQLTKGLAVDGSIALNHVSSTAVRRQAADIVAEVLPYLQERGFSFVRLSEMFPSDQPLQAGRDEMWAFFTVILAGLIWSCYTPGASWFPAIAASRNSEQELASLEIDLQHRMLAES